MEINDQEYNVKKEIKRNWFLLLIILCMFVVGIIAYPYLPEKMVTHWGVNGQPNGFMSKFFGTFFLPLIILGIYLLMIFMPLIDPRRENYIKFLKGYRFIRISLVVFLAGLYIISIVYNLGHNIDIGKIVTIGLGLFFILLGNYLPQVRHNYFVGIKVPWTLASESVWKKTHRLAGKLYVISGILIEFSLFLGDRPRFWIMMFLLIGSSIVATVYSFLLYRKEK